MKLRKIKKVLKGLGPGFVTGASDDDPTGIATYTQTGSTFGYSQLWLSPFSLPFMIAVQEMSGRIGIVTGRGLSRVIRQHYPKQLLYLIVLGLAVSNIFAVGANLGAMSQSIQLLAEPAIDVPFLPVTIFITITVILLQVLIPYKRYTKILKYLAVFLLAYVVAAFFIDGKHWPDILKGAFIPTITISQDYMLNIVAVLGTTISPYLFFWQTSHEVEEAVKNKQLRKINAGRPKMNINNIKKMKVDTILGMLFSNIVMFFIIATAATFISEGKTIETATDAAKALEDIGIGKELFALGIIGTGLLAIPILSGSAAYAIAEVFNWKASLALSFKKAPKFYGLIALLTMIGFTINFIGISVFQTLYYAAVISGFVSPPIIFLMLRITNNKKIMGHYTSSRLTNVLGYLIVTIMTLSAGFLLFSIIS